MSDVTMMCDVYCYGGPLYCYGNIHCGPWCHDPVRVVIIVCRSDTQICTLWSVASPLKTIFILLFYTVWGLLPG